MHLEFLLYIVVHQGPPWLWDLVLKPYQSMHCFTPRQSLTWGEGVWKNPFPFQFFNLEFLPPPPPRSGNTFVINCWHCKNTGTPGPEWHQQFCSLCWEEMLSIILVPQSLERQLENHWMVHSSQGLRTEGKQLCPTFGSFFLLGRTKIADGERMVRARMASLCPSKVGPSPAVLVLEGRLYLSEECSPKWVPYSMMLIAVENIYERSYLMKWFVDPKKLLYLIKSTAQEI